MSTVPRVATSIDDLRVGMVVAHRMPTLDHASQWEILWCSESQIEYLKDRHTTGFSEGNYVILSEPPPEPVTVSREAFDRLAEAWDEWVVEGARVGMNPVLYAARALVDEARGNE